VFVDETELARMDNGRYFAHQVNPGKHIIRMTDDKKGYAFDMGRAKRITFGSVSRRECGRVTERSLSTTAKRAVKGNLRKLEVYW
jgi:hypothetical protein